MRWTGENGEVGDEGSTEYWVFSAELDAVLRATVNTHTMFYHAARG